MDGEEEMAAASGDGSVEYLLLADRNVVHT